MLSDLTMNGLTIAVAAELFQLNPVRVILFVLHRGVVPLFAIRTSKSNDNAHSRAPPPIGRIAPTTNINRRTPAQRGPAYLNKLAQHEHTCQLTGQEIIG